jgi:hypothetical protein
MGITALGVAEAQSGDWDKVDVYLQVEGDSEAKAVSALSASDFDIDLDGQRVPATNLRSVAGSPARQGRSAAQAPEAGRVSPASLRGQGWMLSNLPAAGGLLTVKLATKDALALDNSASIRLPDRPRLLVQLSASLDKELRPVLEADPAVQVVDSGAKVVIRKQGESLGAGLPTLEFVRADPQQPAFVIVHPEKLDSRTVFQQAVEAIGLKEIDAMSLAEAARRAIEVSVATGPQWRFQVWEDLLSADYDFAQSKAFPLFIANAVRWLADSRSGFPYVAAGQPLPGQALASGERVVDAQGRVIDPLGVPFTPEKSGEIRLEGQPHPLSVSLLDSTTTLGSAGAALPAPSLGSAILWAQPAFWLLLAALVLLCIEWYLHQTSRVP